MHDVTLYTRRNCSLCDKAKAEIEASGIPVRLTEIDVDKDATLRQRYTNDVPVILVDGIEAFRHRLTAREFTEYIATADEIALSAQKCVACRGGMPPLHGDELRELGDELGGGWRIVDEHHLEKEFAFPDFVSALAFTNAVGAVAEEEGHHPDIHLAWGKVRVTTWTHKIDGLTRSDFVLAAKIDAVAPRA